MQRKTYIQIGVLSALAVMATNTLAGPLIDLFSNTIKVRFCIEQLGSSIHSRAFNDSHNCRHSYDLVQALISLPVLYLLATFLVKNTKLKITRTQIAVFSLVYTILLTLDSYAGISNGITVRLSELSTAGPWRAIVYMLVVAFLSLLAPLSAWITHIGSKKPPKTKVTDKEEPDA